MSNETIRNGVSRFERTFWSVIECYQECRSRQPVCAVSYGTTDQTHRLSPDAIHYLVDVELCIKKALPTNLFPTFWQLVIYGDQDSFERTEDVMKTIKLCGREFALRNLQPGRYFSRKRAA